MLVTPMTENKQLFSIREAASYLGVSYKTVWRMIIGKQLDAQRVGFQWRIPREALLKDIDGVKKTEKQ